MALANFRPEKFFPEGTTLSDLQQALVDEKAGIAKRTRAVFLIKEFGAEKAIDTLATGLESTSVLLSHEIAYVLGQTGNPAALPHLSRVLDDSKYDPVLRHECAEAMAAIGEPESIAMLEKYAKDASCKEVQDTCLIALEALEYRKTHEEFSEKSAFSSVDPAPAETTTDIDALTKQLTETSLSHFKRYKAMFKLRNIGSAEAIEALQEGFKDDSAVFRHEVAFVMGQLQHPAAIEALVKVLKDKNEHAMVRHEAAEALGAIADEDENESKRVTPLLTDFRSDTDAIVSESCDVALSMAEYWAEFNKAAGDEEKSEEKATEKKSEETPKE